MKNKLLLTTIASLIIVLALSACGGSAEVTTNMGKATNLHQ